MCFEIIPKAVKLFAILIIGLTVINSIHTVDEYAITESRFFRNQFENDQVNIVTVISDKDVTEQENNIYPIIFDSDSSEVEEDDDNGTDTYSTRFGREDIEEENEVLKSCLLENKDFISWWLYSNGSLVDSLVRDAHIQSLDFSYHDSDEEMIFEEVIDNVHLQSHRKILAFSAAGNRLTSVPFRALSFINKTLSYLTLRGNNFHPTNYSVDDQESMYQWAKFPPLYALKELDIGNCSIKFLNSAIFENLPNLESLFLNQNNIISISSDLFKYTPLLQHIDISHIETQNINYYGRVMGPLLTFNEGLTIAEFAFKNLEQLKSFDASFTKISPTSSRALSYFGPSLEYISLCFTGLPLISYGMFENTNLRIMDLSGNPGATLDLNENSFIGLEDSLEILSFQSSRIRDLNWLKMFKKLAILNLSMNNINILHKLNFSNLKDIQLIDLSSNHISNWYHSVFEENNKLALLNVADNNINLITSEMYKDFSNVTYIAIGRNDFICNCFLRDLIDVAVNNSNVLVKCDNNNSKCCTNNCRPNFHNLLANKIMQKKIFTQKRESDILNKIVKRYADSLLRSYENLNHLVRNNLYYKALIDEKFENLKYHFDGDNQNHFNKEVLPFNFQLLDYAAEDYWCYNPINNSGHQFSDLQPCVIPDILPEVKEFNHTSEHLIIVFAVLSVAFILAIPLYIKRWHIKYFFIVLKNSAAIRFLHSEKSKKHLKMSPYMYDIFVSYCDKDRDWVLDELIPHIESNEQVSICLHERDFQVGLSILENIVSCMDRSRCFLLVISKYFLSSQWCQFEMYLAQHRLFEKRKEHLIVVFLEDIPRSKRPKGLQYLMQIKTYIKWPTEETTSSPVFRSISEERKLFWIRLKRTLLDIEKRKEIEETTV